MRSKPERTESVPRPPRKLPKRRRQQRIQEAVDAALAKQAAEMQAAASGGRLLAAEAANTGVAASFGIDWSACAATREVTHFLSGPRLRWKWVLNGRDHGGARAFLKARRQLCHFLSR